MAEIRQFQPVEGVDGRKPAVIYTFEAIGRLETAF
jgi:hypothetical protein